MHIFMGVLAPHDRAFSHGHGRRFIKKGMCRMRPGYASSGVLAQVLQMQGSGAHTHHVFQGAQ